MIKNRQPLIEHALFIMPMALGSLISIMYLMGPRLLILILGLVGTGLIAYAKWPLFKQGSFASFGTFGMSETSRKYYFRGYVLVILSISLGVAAIFTR